MHISNKLVLVVLLLNVFFAFMFSLFSLLLYVFIDVRLSHLNKHYLLTYFLWLLTSRFVCRDCSVHCPCNVEQFFTRR